MDANKKSILKFIKKYKGQLCLDCCGELVLLVGFYEDTEDYYYDCLTLSNAWSTNGKVHHSCVGWMIPLKPQLNKKSYNYLDMFFKNNWTSRYGEESLLRLIKK